MVSLFEYFMPSVQAEEPKQDAEGETHQESGNGDEKAETGSDEGKGEVVESGESKEETEEEEAPAEEEEEEEEEPEDAAPAIQEACANSKQCAAAKHHFEECNSKVSSGHGHKGEDCVEEFFHLRHCVDTCASNKIFAQLK